MKLLTRLKLRALMAVKTVQGVISRLLPLTRCREAIQGLHSVTRCVQSSTCVTDPISSSTPNSSGLGNRGIGAGYHSIFDSGRVWRAK